MNGSSFEWGNPPAPTQEITEITTGTLNIVYATHEGHLIDCKNGGNRPITIALPANSTVGSNALTHIIDIFIRQGGSTGGCLLYTSPSPRDRQKSRMPSSA